MPEDLGDEIAQAVCNIQAKADEVVAMQASMQKDLTSALDGKHPFIPVDCPQLLWSSLRYVNLCRACADTAELHQVQKAVDILRDRARTHSKLLKVCSELEKRCEQAEQRLHSLEHHVLADAS